MLLTVMAGVQLFTVGSTLKPMECSSCIIACGVRKTSGIELAAAVEHCPVAVDHEDPRREVLLYHTPCVAQHLNCTGEHA